VAVLLLLFVALHHASQVSSFPPPAMLPRKVAILTGASSGIGRATAVELSHGGWSVVLVARNQRALTDTVLLCSTSVDVVVEPGDVTDEQFVLGVFARAAERFGECVGVRDGWKALMAR
jgi:NAD(P)-dependent dehydrogenase (short-subunit alcohol dehydrogenase family)